ncbi:hypothetical protein B0H15DRAFT_948119 [Mycena belliarum]|uniref:Uncharacterized protein n=1 Tax=Mycena belliarum TaxID=1033014 RepID=A0AAD6UBD3_9AGAR|nr:hypothetical protein B0H15DRAFT_948119 [Mycena belliae]
MHGALKLVMCNIHTTLSTMLEPLILPAASNRLTIQSRKPTPGSPPQLTLRGIWRAANPNGNAPTAEALPTLHEELVQDDEEHLFGKALWSSSLQATETRRPVSRGRRPSGWTML